MVAVAVDLHDQPRVTPDEVDFSSLDDDVRLRPGEAVQVRVVRSAGRRPAPVAAEVRWCAPAAAGTYRAGLRLGRALTPGELADLAL